MTAISTEKTLKMPNILVILGPTATGKSDLAVELARTHNGEVISADSRQVYAGLDIGTGKITKKEMRGVPHHLLDVLSPKKVFTVSEWKTLAEETVEDILSRGKLPIICGGTGFYIQSIVNDLLLPEVPPNTKLREKLEKKSPEALLKILQKLDPERAQTVEQKNPVRLVRAIEIATALGKVPVISRHSKSIKYNFIQIGLTLPEEKLKEKIETRLKTRMKAGMVQEARRLHEKGLSWKRMRELGLEYRHLADFLTHKISKEKLFENIKNGNWDYAKRQMTWFKIDKEIQWFSPENRKEIMQEVEKRLKNKI